VHHIRPFREFRDSAEANQRENLIGLCQSCHMKTEPRIKGQSALQPQVNQTS
jgi:predicted HNH restriction endonuclease